MLVLSSFRKGNLEYFYTNTFHSQEASRYHLLMCLQLTIHLHKVFSTKGAYLSVKLKTHRYQAVLTMTYAVKHRSLELSVIPYTYARVKVI